MGRGVVRKTGTRGRPTHPSRPAGLPVDADLATGFGERAVDPRGATMDDDEAWAMPQYKPVQNLLDEVWRVPIPIACHDDPHAGILTCRWTNDHRPSLAQVSPSRGRDNEFHRGLGLREVRGDHRERRIDPRSRNPTGLLVVDMLDGDESTIPCPIGTQRLLPPPVRDNPDAAAALRSGRLSTSSSSAGTSGSASISSWDRSSNSRFHGNSSDASSVTSCCQRWPASGRIRSTPPVGPNLGTGWE
jgi:hypothetical protein